MVGIRKVYEYLAMENLISIVGMATALQQATLHQEENFNQVQKLGQELVNGLAAYDWLRVNANEDDHSICLEPWLPRPNDVLLMRLDLAGISVSRFCLYRRYHSTVSQSVLMPLWKDSSLTPKRILLNLVFQNSIP